MVEHTSAAYSAWFQDFVTGLLVQCRTDISMNYILLLRLYHLDHTLCNQVLMMVMIKYVRILPTKMPEFIIFHVLQ